jgi:hypothetical protein
MGFHHRHVLKTPLVNSNCSQSIITDSEKILKTAGAIPITKYLT